MFNHEPSEPTLLTHEQLLADQQELLGKLQGITEPYVVQVSGTDILVHPGVFPPTTDTKLLASHIDVEQGVRVLDLTCGSGVYSVLSGLQGATGIAADINPKAVANANANCERYELDFQTIQSDLFSNIPTEQFDCIFVNGPYIEGDIRDPLEHAFFGAKSYVERFAATAPGFLSPKGKVLITFAEFGDFLFFESTIDAAGFTRQLVERRVNSRGVLAYRLYELTLK